MVGKHLLTALVAVALSAVAAEFALAQGKKDQALGADVSTRCANVSPGLKDECVRQLRAQNDIGSERSWQGGAARSDNNPGIGQGIGGGQGKGRR